MENILCNIGCYALVTVENIFWTDCLNGQICHERRFNMPEFRSIREVLIETHKIMRGLDRVEVEWIFPLVRESITVKVV